MKSPLNSTGNEIELFWRWFSEHSSQLDPDSISNALVAELEKRLFSICRLDWEIGPGIDAANLFALSPRGEDQLLLLTRMMVARAPRLPDWEFYPAKPP